VTIAVLQSPSECSVSVGDRVAAPERRFGRRAARVEGKSRASIVRVFAYHHDIVIARTPSRAIRLENFSTRGRVFLGNCTRTAQDAGCDSLDTGAAQGAMLGPNRSFFAVGPELRSQCADNRVKRVFFVCPETSAVLAVKDYVALRHSERTATVTRSSIQPASTNRCGKSENSLRHCLDDLAALGFRRYARGMRTCTRDREPTSCGSE